MITCHHCWALLVFQTYPQGNIKLKFGRWPWSEIMFCELQQESLWELHRGQLTAFPRIPQQQRGRATILEQVGRVSIVSTGAMKREGECERERERERERESERRLLVCKNRKNWWEKDTEIKRVRGACGRGKKNADTCVKEQQVDWTGIRQPSF